jgi:hypothetical protein
MQCYKVGTCGNCVSNCVEFEENIQQQRTQFDIPRQQSSSFFSTLFGGKPERPAKRDTNAIIREEKIQDIKFAETLSERDKMQIQLISK